MQQQPIGHEDGWQKELHEARQLFGRENLAELMLFHRPVDFEVKLALNIGQRRANRRNRPGGEVFGQQIAAAPRRARDGVAGKPGGQRHEQAIGHAEQGVGPYRQGDGPNDRRRGAIANAKPQRDDHDG